MSGLAELQADLQAFVTDRKPAALEHVIGDARAPAEERLDIYYDAYRLRLGEVLAKDYAGLVALLGGEPFDALTRDYLHACPSRHPSVRWLGRELATYLEDHFSDRPELAEMARFEWAWGLAFDAEDAEPIAPDALASLAPAAWPTLVFGVHASVQQIELHANVPEIFLAVTRDEALPVLTRSDDATHWLIWRDALTVKWRSQKADEAWALARCREGATFAGLCEGLCQWHDADAVPALGASMLKQWLSDGLMTGAASS